MEMSDEILKKYGEPINPKWKLIVSEPVHFDSEWNEIPTPASKEFHFASEKSYGDNKTKVTETESTQDNNGFLVRYKYGNRPSKDSRDFCKRMTSLSANGTVFTKESILKMGRDGVNGKWSERGKSTYSIWLYKGGGGCRHLWWRQVFNDGTGKLTSRDKAKRKGYKEPKNDKKVPSPPCTMPNAAFINRDGTAWKCS